MPGKRLKNVGGMLVSKTNIEIHADRMPPIADTAIARAPMFNTFVAANYHGSQQTDTVNYFFVKPKPMEVDTIRCAFWNANTAKMRRQSPLPRRSVPRWKWISPIWKSLLICWW